MDVPPDHHPRKKLFLGQSKELGKGRSCTSLGMGSNGPRLPVIKIPSTFLDGSTLGKLKGGQKQGRNLAQESPNIRLGFGK